jgi:hypothetical protein
MNSESMSAAVDAVAEDAVNATADVHEATSAIHEDAEPQLNEALGNPDVAGIAPEASGDSTGPADPFAGVKLAPPPLVLVSSQPGVTLGGVATAVVKGVTAGTAAKVIGDALPDNTHWAVRLGATVTGGVIAAVAVGAAIDAAAGWFGKDTVV